MPEQASTPLAPLLTRASLPPLDPARFAPTPERPLRAKARWLAQRSDIQPHQHTWGQLVFSISGAVRVMEQGPLHDSTFIVPPARAVWIPPGRTHAVMAIEQAELRTVYLHPQAIPRLDEPLPGPDSGWQHARVVEVSPLLRELVLQLAVGTEAELDDAASLAREQCISRLILDELRRARVLRLGLPLPQERRLRRLCEAMLAEPMRHADLEGWCTEVGASARTVARLFREELGSSFSQWRQQLLLGQALSLAARKMPMRLIAAELGYASPSAFSAMVKRAMGLPPSQFFESV
jgi:AraC-like DNA-binding protein